jgi:probable HAF family extracellular repeat protein
LAGLLTDATSTLWVGVSPRLRTLQATPNAINDAGEVTGYYTDANFVPHGFVYQNGVFTTVDDPLGVGGTQIFGINDAGQLVGQYFDASGNGFGFLATPDAPTAVPEPASLTLLAVVGICLASWRLCRLPACSSAV